MNISDIHVGSEDKPENEGLVLRKFITDVEEQILKFTYDDCYVLISGDLVFAASDNNYSKFDELIIQELMRVLSVDRSHFIIAPGNHDVTQNALNGVEESFLPIFENKYDENRFNDLIRKPAQRDILFGKFNAFLNYVTNNFVQKGYSLEANLFPINDIWSIHVLNSAILSCGAYKDIDDLGHLGVDTRSLHDFLAKDKHPKKILLMHHPEYFCMDWVKTLIGFQFEWGRLPQQRLAPLQLANRGCTKCQSKQGCTSYIGISSDTAPSVAKPRGHTGATRVAS